MERRHRPGLKLLMTANHKCNLSHEGTAEDLLAAYGAPVNDFLRPAITAFPPSAIRRWYDHIGLRTTAINGRIFPASQQADDVLHALLDHLRDREFPLLYNCPVTAIRRLEDGYLVESNHLKLSAKCVLLATGGCSYPKTGSTGDGMKFAAELGLRTEPVRAGLAAIELPGSTPLADLGTLSQEMDEVRVFAENLSATGNLVFDRGLVRGSAIFDLTRLAARQNIILRSITLDFLPRSRPSQEMLTTQRLNALGVPPMLAQALTGRAGKISLQMLKNWTIPGIQVRPIKEAIVTVGGISCSEFNPGTMESRALPGFFAAGETLDIDGPTGGYNLHAAYATAALAIRAIGERLGVAPRLPRRAVQKANPRSAFGKGFWDEHKKRFGR